MNEQKAATLRTALIQNRAADDRLRRLICEFFPVGAQVRWWHGDNIRSGLVKSSSGFRAGMLRLNIESKSGKTQWIYASRLLSFVEQQYGEYMDEHGDELKMWSVLCCDICWELEVVAPSPEAAKSITKEHFDGHLKCRTSKMVCEVIELSEDENLQDVGARVLVAHPKGLSSRFRRKWKRIDV